MIVVVAPQSTGVEGAKHLGVVLVGSDGSDWDLINGGVQLQPGFAGLGPPDPEHWWRDSPSLPGSAYLGSRDPRGEVVMPVKIAAETAQAWRVLQSSFMRAIDHAGVCSLQVTAPESVPRTMALRLTGGANPPYQIDPFLLRHASYTLEFATPDPYWRGAPVSYTYTGVDLHPNTVGVATVVNPGDVPAYPKWTITGAFSAVTVGVGDSLVSLGTAVANGNSRIINTDPRYDGIAVTAANGADRWVDVVDRDFSPIPAGSAVSVQIGVDDPGVNCSVKLEFTPAYRQAW